MMFNTVLAVKLLDEEFTRYDFISVLMISAGATICVLFAHYEPVYYSADVSLWS